MMLVYYQTIFAAVIGVSLGLITRSPAVDVWLSQDEVSRISGKVSVEPFYIIQDGMANPSLSAFILGNHGDRPLDQGEKRLLLPAEVNSLKILWRAPKPFHYTFLELRSNNPSVMGPPLLTITLDDSMPSNDTEFRMDFPCTGELSGLASVSVILRIRHLKTDLDIPASPLHLSFDKQCLEGPTCEPRCANGGVCNGLGRCECPDGFYGHTCRIIFCIPHCYNGGTCVAPGVCACKKGFTGNRCQKGVCQSDCTGHGYCYKPGFCFCYSGWTGVHCDQRVNLSPQTFETTTYRSKNLRLVKNRRYWSDAS